MPDQPVLGQEPPYSIIKEISKSKDFRSPPDRPWVFLGELSDFVSLSGEVELEGISIICLCKEDSGSVAVVDEGVNIEGVTKLEFSSFEVERENVSVIEASQCESCEKVYWMIVM